MTALQAWLVVVFMTEFVCTYHLDTIYPPPIRDDEFPGPYAGAGSDVPDPENQVPRQWRTPIPRNVLDLEEKPLPELQVIKGPNLSYLPPVMEAFQPSDDHSLEAEQDSDEASHGQSGAEGQTSKDFAPSVPPSSSGGSGTEKNSLLVAAEVLSLFNNIKQEDLNEELLPVDDYLEHEEGSGRLSVYDSSELKGRGDEVEGLVQKSEFEEREFPTFLAHVTATEKIFLAWPVVKQCLERRTHAYYFGTQGYYLNSWDLSENDVLDPETGEKSSKTFSWAEARSQCRKRCMDAISFDNQAELQMISKILASNNIPHIWTSGRICDFVECAGKPEVQPLPVNGWLWTATGDRLPPTNAKPQDWSFQPWSTSGISDDPQPDNAEFAINGKNESCLAVLNNVYGDRITFHDIACHHKKYFICEDSPALMDLVFEEHGTVLARVPKF